MVYTEIKTPTFCSHFNYFLFILQQKKLTVTLKSQKFDKNDYSNKTGSQINPHTYACAHARMHTCTHTHTHTHTHRHTCTHMCTHVWKEGHMHACAHSRMRTRMRAHTHAHAQVHAHAHTMHVHTRTWMLAHVRTQSVVIQFWEIINKVNFRAILGTTNH